MKNTFKYIAVMLFITVFTSCETEEGFEDFTLEKSAVGELAGDWYVKTFLGDSEEIGYSLLTTSNTSSDDGTKIQIFDHKNIWWFNTQASVSGLTFSGTELTSNVDGYEITVNITNGLVKKGGTVTSDTNLVADLISFDIEFSDDPGKIYHIEGYRRSGLLEDEH